MGMKKKTSSALRFLASMKFGMLLLGLLALYATAGTLIPQGQTISYYRENYSSTLFFIIEKLKLFEVYDSIYFISLTALLTLNLLFCTIRRIPSARTQYQKEGNASLHLKKNHQVVKELNEGANPKELLKSLGFRKIKELEEQGQKIYFSSRRRAGYFGSTFVHLGLLFIIAAFALGKIMGYESFVRGIPGDLLPVESTSYTLSLQDFDIFYREDYSIQQYLSSVEVLDEGETVKKRGDTSVNHPLSFEGYRVYQYGTGWMMDLIIRKQGEEILRDRFYQGDFKTFGESLVLEFRSFYPDFIVSEGMPYTKTPFLNRPRALYVLYENGRSVDMNVAGPGQTISYGDYTMELYEPRLYTVLQIVKDPGAVYAGLGGFLMLAGLFLTFYYVPQYLLLIEKEGRVTLYGGAVKNQESFRIDIYEKLSVESAGDLDESD